MGPAQSAVLQADTQAKVAEGVDKLRAALKVGRAACGRSQQGGTAGAWHTHEGGQAAAVLRVLLLLQPPALRGARATPPAPAKPAASPGDGCLPAQPGQQRGRQLLSWGAVQVRDRGGWRYGRGLRRLRAACRFSKAGLPWPAPSPAHSTPFPGPCSIAEVLTTSLLQRALTYLRAYRQASGGGVGWGACTRRIGAAPQAPDDVAWGAPRVLAAARRFPWIALAVNPACPLPLSCLPQVDVWQLVKEGELQRLEAWMHAALDRPSGER